jgi:hypothetical protein
VSNRFAVVYEAQADFATATELADRVLAAEIPWVDETLLDSRREWIAEDPSGSRLTWKAIPSRARELGIQVRGFFDGKPDLPDAQPARRAIAYVRRCFDAVDAILLIRDMDDQPERRGGLEQTRESASPNIKIVIGVAIVEREGWILSGFEPRNDDEQARLNAESQSLGFNPCLRPQKLTACKDDTAKRSPKRMLAVLTHGDWDRQRDCWKATSLAVLEARGQGNGLKDYLGEVRDRLVPLITGHEREPKSP